MLLQAEVRGERFYVLYRHAAARFSQPGFGFALPQVTMPGSRRIARSCCQVFMWLHLFEYHRPARHQRQT
jgi:hypothetical protein